MNKVFPVLLALVAMVAASSASALINETGGIKLNQKEFAKGVLIDGELFVRVTDVAKAVNGTAKLAPRLAVKDGSLVGVTAGGCGACQLKVGNTGKAIGPVKTLEGTQFIEVLSLSGALGGSVEKVGGGADITAAPCASCALSTVPPK